MGSADFLGLVLLGDGLEDFIGQRRLVAINGYDFFCVWLGAKQENQIVKIKQYYIFFPKKQDISVLPATQANYAGRLRVVFLWMKNKVVLGLNLS